MNPLEVFLSWSSITFQLALCCFVFARQAHRALPLFSAYVYVITVISIGVCLLQWRWGFYSTGAYYTFWASAYIFGVARSLAILELCRFELRQYRGIWALVWRLLASVALLFLVHGIIDAHGQPDGIAIFGSTFLRDLAFASVAILIALLLIRRYYGLALDPLQRLVAAGMCLTCTVDALGYTFFRNALTGYLYSWFVASQKASWQALFPQIRLLDDIWSAVHLAAFMVAIGIWCYALREPVSRPQRPTLLPVEVYGEMSPAINAQLAAFNGRLSELLKS
jgi:hypothetical protein